MQRTAGPAEGTLLAEEQPGQIDVRSFGCRDNGLADQQFSVADDVGQFRESHLGQVFPNFPGQERKIIDQVISLAYEMLPQFRVLRSHARGASVQTALSHHHAAEHD